MKILLSIKPEYANKILTGEKKFEFRKIGFNNKKINTVVIYATKPVGKVIGEFEVLEVHSGAPKTIWEKTKRHAGIDKIFFDSYYNGRSKAFAIAVGDVTRYEEPVELNEIRPGLTPPQSFCYLSKQENLQAELEFPIEG